MRQLIIIFFLFVGFWATGQITDSVVTHLPNTINCTGVKYYVDNALKGTNTSKTGSIKLTMSKFGLVFTPSDMAGYSKFITNKLVKITATGCKSEIIIHRHIYQTGSLNE